MNKISNNTFLSIIIPIYNNRQQDILRCLECIIDKSNAVRYEIILVDDGSKKDCADFLDRISKKESNIVVFHQSNQGPAIARNQGMAVANGKYILFVDADDEIPKQFWHDLHCIAYEAFDFDIIYGLVQLKSIKDTIQSNSIVQNFLVEKINKSNCERLYRQLIDLKEKKFRYPQGYISRGPIARLVKKELALRHPFNPSLFLGEDQIWNLDLLNHANDIGIIPHCWYYYIKNPNSITHKPNPQYIEWCAILIKTLSQYIYGPQLNIAFGNRIFQALNDVAKTMYLPNIKIKNLWKRVSAFKYLSHSYPFNLIPQDYFCGGINPFIKYSLYKTNTLILAFGVIYAIEKINKK